ncbi:MAG: glutamate 5-kinase [Patescibacteria group bacterium]
MRLVIKIGTYAIFNEKGLDLSRIKQITSEIAELMKMGHEVILVSSGAAGYGMHKIPELGPPFRKKIWASVGQPMIFNSYMREAEEHGFSVGQMLLLRDDFTNRESFSNMTGVIESMLAFKILPILNENDVLKTEDLTVGDNDILSAMVAIALSADKLIIITNKDGLFSDNPDKNKDAELIKVVSDIDFEIEKFCSKEKSNLGTGGMLSKVRAAKHAVSSGVEVLLGNGTKKGIILSTLEKDFYGTRFVPSEKISMNEAKRWMMATKGVGLLAIDDGAIEALRGGKSLLLPGLISAKGEFSAGEIVEVVSKFGQAVAYGRVNYPANEIKKAIITQKKSLEKGVRILEKEIIHRDYMVILKK